VNVGLIMNCVRLGLKWEMDVLKLPIVLLIKFLDHYRCILWKHRMCLKFMVCDVWW
jgi:hypothetical protein